jgi:signal transduction histidine kinase
LPRFPDRAVYLIIGIVTGIAAIALSYTALAQQFDNNIVDWLTRLRPVHEPAHLSAILAFDESTYKDYGGVGGLRRTLAAALERMTAYPPAVVAIDLTLADLGNRVDDAALAAAFADTRNLVLAYEMLPDGSGWQDPPEIFRRRAAAFGHVHVQPDLDNVLRNIALERVAGGSQRFALSLEALRLYSSAPIIITSPTDVEVGKLRIESRWDEGRPLRIHYRDFSLIPHVKVRDLLLNPELARQLAGRVVFAGVTALSASPDRWFTPLSTSRQWPGVEIHAQAFETMFSKDFLYDAPLLLPALLAFGGAAIIALLFAFAGSRTAYAGAALTLLLLHLAPWYAFRLDTVLAPSAPVAAGWLCFLGAFSYRFFVARRRLEVSEQMSQRYQQAFRFVAHELRTPLTAIQGSGELLTRYNLPDEKRRQLAGMIQNESRRLAKMITTFLDVEKMSAGQMELRLEPVVLRDLAATVIERARPLADRKHIAVNCVDLDGITFTGDRELLEYAVYNLLTNAIKYSPPDREVGILASLHNGALKLTVRDQGIGLDEEDLKKLFTRFFRSRRAESTGEAGTGIGLAIVDQIVKQHNGRIEVVSRPGEGSAFTIHLPAS